MIKHKIDLDRLLDAIKTVVIDAKKCTKHGSMTFNMPENIDTFEAGCELARKGYDVSCKLTNNKKDSLTIVW